MSIERVEEKTKELLDAEAKIQELKGDVEFLAGRIGVYDQLIEDIVKLLEARGKVKRI